MRVVRSTGDERIKRLVTTRAMKSPIDFYFESVAVRLLAAQLTNPCRSVRAQ